jgi:hypothetical protein
MIAVFFGGFISPEKILAQKKAHISMRDSLDGAIDMSDYVIHSNGFIPVPVIITEPALGGFGGGIVPIFIKQRPPYRDSVRGKELITPVPPDITGGIGAYTLNDTWIADVFRSGTLIKSRIKYVLNLGYANVNMKFYRDILNETDKEFNFNFRMIPAFIQVSRRLGYSRWYAGMKYTYLNMQIRYKGEDVLPDELGVTDEYTRNLSILGGLVELDKRDNIFTPNRGMKVHLDAQCSNNALGSDYNYWRLNYYAYMYLPISPRFVGGWRVDGQQSFDDAPFFMLPYLDMRGLPVYKYQGNADLLTEVEGRFAVTKRWSLMAFGGLGKAFNDWSEFGDSKLIYTYGTGFRYMMARKLGLHMGADVAFGPNGDWGYYIVFGSSWLK